MRKRVYYNKKDEMKYISHLDMLRFIERILKISGIKPKFTQGFHPRPKITYGNALSLGVESYNEIFEYDDSEQGIENIEIEERLREKSPIGFEIVKVESISDRSSIVTDFNAIAYKLEFPNEESYNEFKKIVSQNEIIFRKEKNGKVTEKNLKEKIKKIELEEKSSIIYLEEISPKNIIESITESENIKIKRVGYYNL
jgi:radical SAM-linked protein